MQRVASVIHIRPDRIAAYRALHAAVWPTVERVIAKCNIRNYTIFLREPENLLFSYYEYHGDDHDADLRKMAADRETQRWWEVCGPMQIPLATRAEGEWWAPMMPVFHQD